MLGFFLSSEQHTRKMSATKENHMKHSVMFAKHGVTSGDNAKSIIKLMCV